MAHLSKNRTALVNRVRRIAGQVAAVERSVAEDADCGRTLQLVAATRGAMSGLMDELVADYVREHVARADATPEVRAEAAEELIAIISRYSR